MEIEKKENPEMRDDEELKRLIIHSIKELDEIAEVLVKKDMKFEHWRNELGDLCGLCIRPMLQLAEMDFETACEIGLERKLKKMKEKKEFVRLNIEAPSIDLVTTKEREKELEKEIKERLSDIK